MIPPDQHPRYRRFYPNDGLFSDYPVAKIQNRGYTKHYDNHYPPRPEGRGVKPKWKRSFMRRLQKPDGFEHEQLFVIPEIFLAGLSENPLSKYLVVTDIGYFPRAEYHFRERPGGCETAILMYCSAGSGYYRVNNREAQILSPKQLIIIPPNTPHEYGASEDNPWSIYWAHIKGPLFTAYYDMISRYVPLVITDVLGEQMRNIFSQCFTLLKTPYQAEEYFYLCQTIATVLALIPCAGKQSVIQLSVNGNRGVNKAITFMRDHIHDLITLEQLSAVSGLSASHLNYLFKKSTGHAPIDYFLRTKIQVACRDLSFSNLPNKDIAAAYGIEDPYYFSRLFKKITGLSPQQYRSRTRQ
jgi:AraC-like DNA-binding protein